MIPYLFDSTGEGTREPNRRNAKYNHIFDEAQRNKNLNGFDVKEILRDHSTEEDWKGTLDVRNFCFNGCQLNIWNLCQINRALAKKYVFETIKKDNNEELLNGKKKKLL